MGEHGRHGEHLTTDVHQLYAAARGGAGDTGMIDDGLGPVLIGHSSVRTTLADPGTWRSGFIDVLEMVGVTGGHFHDWMARSPLNRDGDVHKAWRAAMVRAFTPRQVEELRPFLARRSHELIDALPEGEPFDFVEVFARTLPLDALCALIGVPAEDRDDFGRWADTIGIGFDFGQVATNIDDIDGALSNLLAYTTDLIRLRQRDPRDDLVSRIAASAAAGETTEEDAAGSVAGLVFAGHDTTKNQLGTTYVLLASTPGAWDDVARGAVTPRDAVEEILRLRGAVPGVGRVPAESEPGVSALGTLVRASLWAANRDPDAFASPDDYAPVDHCDSPHLAFGHGPHHCLGAALARAELVEAVAALTARLECPEIGGVEWDPPVGITGPHTIPTTVRRRCDGQPAA